MQQLSLLVARSLKQTTPSTPRDPNGIHKLIWDEILEEEFTFPAGKDRILASYESGGEQTAYVEPVTIGDTLPKCSR